MSRKLWQIGVLPLVFAAVLALLLLMHTISTQAQPDADITIAKSVDGPAFAMVGDRLTYTLEIQNNSATSTTVVVTDFLSFLTDPITYTGEIEVGSGTGTVIVGQGGTVNAAAGVLYTWDSVQPIPPGESFTLNIVVRINKEAEPNDIITNVAWANGVRSNQTSVKVWGSILLIPIVMRGF